MTGPTLEEARTQRTEIVDRLNAAFGRLKLADPPSLAPIDTGETNYDQRTTPMVVLSLAGLETLEGIVTELEQLRPAPETP